MILTRRDFLRLTGILTCSVPLVGCSNTTGFIADRLGHGIPEKVLIPQAAKTDPAFHLLSRAGYGPWPGDLEYVNKIGASAWIEQQLHPENIDDRMCEFRTRRFESIYFDAGMRYEFKREVLRKDLARHALLRCVYSKRQLQESMVEFFSDHFLSLIHI